MSNRKPNKFICYTLWMMVIASAYAGTDSQDIISRSTKPFSASILTVHDGDTITVRSHGLKYLIRLWGIDAPESKQPGGKDATKYLKQLIKRKVLKVVPISNGKYGRLIAKLYVGSTFINLAMVQRGHAWWYEKYAPNAKDIEKAQDEAKKSKRGLWNAPSPVAPSSWRRKNRKILNLSCTDIKNAIK